VGQKLWICIGEEQVSERAKRETEFQKKTKKKANPKNTDPKKGLKTTYLKVRAFRQKNGETSAHVKREKEEGHSRANLMKHSFP